MRLVRLSLLLVHSSNSTFRIKTKYGIPFLAREAGFFCIQPPAFLFTAPVQVERNFGYNPLYPVVFPVLITKKYKKCP